MAAKDEEANIETCVRSVLAQDYPNFELIVVDDRSRDGTPAILAKLASECNVRRTDDSLASPVGKGGQKGVAPSAVTMRVLTVHELPDGWFGKNNAMRQGVTASTGEWLLFTDADCRFTSKKAISAAMNAALGQKTDFLSIIPLLDAHAAWEHILQPVCALVLMFWFRPEKVNDPRCKSAYANGAFMLMTRRCYDGVGGHNAVRTELNEDIQLARLAKQAGFRLRVVENDELYRTRMYATFRQAWRGWSRIFAGSLLRPARVFAAASMVLVFSTIPWPAALASLAFWLAGSDGNSARLWAISATIWGAAVILMHVCLWGLYGALGFGRRWSLLYLPGAALMFGILLNSLAKVMGTTSTTWRGTTYRSRSGEVGSITPAAAPSSDVAEIAEGRTLGELEATSS